MGDSGMATPNEQSDQGQTQIRVTQDADVLLVELCRPEVHNACDEQTHNELRDLISNVEGPFGDGLRLLVLAGRGPSFCSGTDLRVTASMDALSIQKYVALDAASKDALAACRVPTVAWIHGYALGGGLELALACDFRAVMPGTTMGLPEVGLGTLPGAGGIQRLSALIGAARAREMIVLGRTLDATSALEVGLATWLVNERASVASIRETLHTLLRLDPTILRLARAALSPHSAVSTLEHVYHQLAAAASRDSGTFRRESASWFERK